MRWIAAIGWGVRIALCCSASAAGDAPEKTDVFISGTEDYHTFRIPAVVLTRERTLLAFCEGRKKSRSDAGDIDLVLRRSTDGGRTWGNLDVVHEEGGNAEITVGNPCPVVDRDTGVVWLPFCRNNQRAFVTHSKDGGRTWAEPVEITD
ncbi:MAG TPA: exo-alpha-sialidase, partial [Candidatus Hydrogenedentes bacterium]|nr:exo-alpha-sialidase [Candidatus Hydrogenedentota bacterium]